jgi:hypothetical protein
MFHAALASDPRVPIYCHPFIESLHITTDFLVVHGRISREFVGIGKVPLSAIDLSEGNWSLICFSFPKYVYGPHE